MQFTSEMNWDDTDFIVWGLLLFFAGSVCLLATRKLPHSKWRGIWRMIAPMADRPAGISENPKMQLLDTADMLEHQIERYFLFVVAKPFIRHCAVGCGGERAAGRCCGAMGDIHPDHRVGLYPNHFAALDLNLLLVNPAWSAVLYVGFLRGRTALRPLLRWQTNYLPILALWAAVVVVAFRPLFAFV